MKPTHAYVAYIRNELPALLLLLKPSIGVLRVDHSLLRARSNAFDQHQWKLYTYRRSTDVLVRSRNWTHYPACHAADGRPPAVQTQFGNLFLAPVYKVITSSWRARYIVLSIKCCSANRDYWLPLLVAVFCMFVEIDNNTSVLGLLWLLLLRQDSSTFSD